MTVGEAIAFVHQSQGTAAAIVRGEEVVVLGGSRTEGSYDSRAIRERYRDFVDDPTGECVNSHAAFDLIVNASIDGLPIGGSKAIVYTLSCVNCAKVLIGSGVREVITAVPITDQRVLTLVSEAGIERSVMRGC
jgi:deoxycytidylate deaminase